ncbi:hypothetical protein HPP92_021659 [Vanilla planifolia]|uniref:Uncharacterized protein n=1 Tax=Vanilla planifolia TaxID=51239 RepID=A0A835UH15_VANPL|nr:hypothetical protein HPP92_021659 [Vanilla planifolia]
MVESKRKEMEARACSIHGLQEAAAEPSVLVTGFERAIDRSIDPNLTNQPAQLRGSVKITHVGYTFFHHPIFNAFMTAIAIIIGATKGADVW